MHENIFIILAVIIILAKVLSDLFIRINIPPVLAMIVIGLVMGPTGFNLIKSQEDMHIVHFCSKLGVIILLFMAGLDTDIEKMKRIGGNTLIIALGGMVLPFMLGFSITYIFFSSVKTALIFGTILTATSVSITVMTLMDLKKLKTVEGNTILGAAIIDDILGILLLTFIFSFLGVGDKSSLMSVIYIFAYLIGAIIIGFIFIPFIMTWSSKLKTEKTLIAVSLSLLLFFAWSAEMVEIAAITGAYLAGLFIGRTRFKHKIGQDMLVLGHSFFISVFFVSIGLITKLQISQKVIIFAVIFSIVAILGKLFGSGLLAKIVGFNWKRSFAIGSGMIPRGEVALIIASIAASPLRGELIESDQFSAVVFMVLITAFVTPFLLKYFFRGKN